MLRVSGMSKRYGRLAALEGVTFTVRPGEVLGLIGPNGAGKTTLFECLAGLLPASAGVLLEGDRPLEARARTLQPPVSGRVGLWSKTDSTSEFKDYVVSTK